jgi:hypothetical protein
VSETESSGIVLSLSGSVQPHRESSLVWNLATNPFQALTIVYRNVSLDWSEGSCLDGRATPVRSDTDEAALTRR